MQPRLVWTDGTKTDKEGNSQSHTVHTMQFLEDIMPPNQANKNSIKGVYIIHVAKDRIHSTELAYFFSHLRHTYLDSLYGGILYAVILCSKKAK